MIEENNEKNENSVESNNKSEKTVIKPFIARIWLNKPEYQYIDIEKKFLFNRKE